MELRKYLPSTQFALIAGAILLSIGLIFAATFIRGGAEVHSAVIALSPDNTGTEGFKDSDGDGLRDWEENLYGSDPQNPDSDGDGTGDKQAAESYAQEAQKDLEGTRFPLAVEGSDNLTATIGQSLFATYASKQKQGGGDDVLTQQNIIAEALSRAQALQEETRAFLPSDLQMTEDSAAAYRAYGNAVIDASNANPRAGYDQALITFSLYTETGSAKDEADLAAIERDFEDFIGGLSALPVPAHFAFVHTQLLTSLEKMRIAVANMRAFKGDPVRALLGADQLRKDGAEAVRYFITIAKEFKNVRITFAAGEAGKDWENLQNLSLSSVLPASSEGLLLPQELP